jgi:hypothetical protein
MREKSRWQIADRPWDLDLHNFKTITPDFHGSKDQVILLFLSTKIPTLPK